MDFKERMEQMRRDMERRRQEMDARMADFRTRVGATTPVGRNNPPSPPQSTENTEPLLKHHPGLEDESETKLGMFERLYAAYPGAQASTVGSFGYSDMDFSPIVNLLASIGEIELYASLRPVSALNMSDPLRKNKSMYWDFLRVLKDRRCKEFLTPYLGNVRAVSKQVNIIRSMRNRANHKEVLTSSDFNDFFTKCYVPFFNEVLPALIPLKKLPENRPPRKTLSEPASKVEKTSGRICVLWTDSEKLALKYYGKIVGRGETGPVNLAEIIRGQLLGFMREAAQPGVAYFLIDLSLPEWSGLIDRQRSWQSCHAVLGAFRKSAAAGHGVTGPMSLFIIGGDDVVPMPKVRNPLDDEIKSANRLDVLEAEIEVDWLYAFPEKNIRVDSGGYLDPEALSGAETAFYVSRLPLESGMMETTFEDDILRYLRRSLDGLRNKIEIGKVGAVTMERCRRVMELMTAGFPLNDISRFPQSCRFGNSFVSPDISLAKGAIDEDVAFAYLNAVKDCGILTFVLHGAPGPNAPYYIGESLEGTQHVAFVPGHLDGSGPKIIVPICCWGARFIGYRRENSMLLTALYSSETLLFMGSCRSAFAPFDPETPDKQPVIGCAQRLMRLFMQNVMAGYPAGEALQRAKIKFLTHYSEGKPYDLLTVQEFNLFGDPMLTAVPCMSSESLDAEISITPTGLPDFSMCDYKYSEDTVFEASEGEVSILEKVRGLVDGNLEVIRSRMNDVLYRHYNIHPDNLRKITRYRTGKGRSGMRFVYARKSAYPCTVYAFSDENGNLKELVRTF